MSYLIFLLFEPSGDQTLGYYLLLPKAYLETPDMCQGV